VSLNETFIKNSTKYTGKPSGEKHSDGGGMYLHVLAAGKYWRMNYRFVGKQKTLSLGVYPAVSLAEARKGRDKAHKLLAQGWSEAHADKWLRMNELYLFPYIGQKPIASIRGKAILDALRKVEAKGILSTAQDLQQMSGQVFRYAVQADRIEQNPVPDLKGALKAHVAKHFAAVIEPVAVGGLLRAIDAYTGQPATVAALKLSALFFQRPGNIRAMNGRGLTWTTPC
jgi:integrase